MCERKTEQVQFPLSQNLTIGQELAAPPAINPAPELLHLANWASPQFAQNRVFCAWKCAPLAEIPHFFAQNCTESRAARTPLIFNLRLPEKAAGWPSGGNLHL